MKMIEQFKNKKVLVLGLAKSGESAARLLDKLGAIVTVNDGKPFDENPTAQSLLEEGIRVICGSHPLDLLDEDFALVVKNPGIRYDNPMVEKALQKGIPVWTEVELAYLISDAPIVGITGSNGKTTTTTMIAEVLNAGHKPAKIMWEYWLSRFICGTDSNKGRYFGHGVVFFPTNGNRIVQTSYCSTDKFDCKPY